MSSVSKVSIEGSTFSLEKKNLGPKKTDAVKFSNLLIADPSLAFELKIDYTPENSNSPKAQEVAIFFRLGIAANNLVYGTDIGLYVPVGQAIDFSAPLHFAIPFTDPDFDNESSQYYFEVRVQVFSAQRADVLLSTTFTDRVPVADVKKTGDFALKFTNGQAPTYGSQSAQHPNDVAFEDIWFHVDGASYGVKLPVITKDKADPVNLSFNANQNTGHGSVASVRGLINDGKLEFDMSTEAAFMWLPHAKVEGIDFSMSSASLNTKVFKLTDVNDPLNPSNHVIMTEVGETNHVATGITLSNQDIIIYVQE